MAETINFRPLGAYFVEAGLLSPAQVQVALNDQAMTGLRFGEILVQRGWMKEATIEYFVDRLIEPERRSLQKSLAWQKGDIQAKTSHRKGFVMGPPAAPPVNRNPVVTGSKTSSNKTAPLRPAAQHRKGFVNPPAPQMPPPAAPAANSEDEPTTCLGLNRSSNYDEASESLVWIG